MGGILYRAIDMRTQKEICIKCYNADFLSRFESDEIRFRRKLDQLVCIHHENILQLIDYGIFEERPYVVFEAVQGVSLRKVSEIEAGAAVSVAIQLASALLGLHKSGLTHKCLNPSNIFLSDQGKINILDTGESHILEMKKISECAQWSDYFRYMAPEATGILKRNVDERSDLFSVGVILYELLTGKLPFNGETLNQILQRSVAGVPQKPGLMIKNFNPVLEEIILKLLQSDPDLRYHSAEGLRHDLQRCKDGDTEILIAEKDPRFNLTYKTRLIGRRHELEQVMIRLKQADMGQGNVCIVHGGSGMGKSRFLEEVRAKLDLENVTYFSGKCVSNENKTPYFPFKAIIDAYIHHVQTMGVCDRIAEIDRIQGIFGELADIIVKINPDFRNLLEYAKPLVSLDPEKENKRFLSVAAGFFCRLSKDTAYIISIDDLQWIDEGSLRLLEVMAGMIGDSKLLLLLTIREEEGEKNCPSEILQNEGDGKEYHVTHFTFQPLAYDRIEELIEYILGEKSGLEKLSRHVYEKSRGNPYFAISILRELIEERLLVWKNGRWWVTDWPAITKIPISGTLIELFLRWVDRVPADLRQALDYAAVIGKEFQLEMLFKLVQVPKCDVAKMLDYAIKLGLIEESMMPGRMQFIHDRVREAILKTLECEKKMEMHGHIARVLEENGGADILFDLVHHFIEAKDHENILRNVFTAGDMAREIYSNAEAVKYYEIGISILEEDEMEGSDQWINAEYKLIVVYLMLGRNDETVEICNNLLRFVGSDESRARIYQSIGAAYLKKGDWGRCEANLAKGLSLLGERLPDSKSGAMLGIVKEFFRLEIWYVNVEIHKSAVVAEIEEKYKFISEIYISLNWMYSLKDTLKFIHINFKYMNFCAKRLSGTKYQATAFLGFSGVLMSIPLYKLARKFRKKSIEMSRSLGDQYGVARALQIDGYNYQWRGEYRKSIHSFNKSIQIMKGIGDLWEEKMCIHGLMESYLWVNDNKNFLRCNDLLIRSCDDLNDIFSNLAAYNYRGWYYIIQGEYGRAEEILLKVIDATKGAGYETNRMFSTFLYAYCKLNCGDYDTALKYISISYGIYKSRIVLKAYYSIVYYFYINIIVEKVKVQGQAMINAQRNMLIRTAGKLCSKALKETRRWTTNYGPVLIVVGKYFCLLGKYEKAGHYFLKGINLLMKTGRKYELAKGYYEYGLMLNMAGRNGESGPFFLNACMIFRDIGAHAYATRLEGLLGAMSVDLREETILDRLTESRKIKIMLDTSRFLSSILELNELLEIIVDKAMELTGAERGYLALMTDPQQAEQEVSDVKKANMEVKRGLNEELNYNDVERIKTITGRVMAEKKPLLLTGADYQERGDGLSDSKATVKSALCVPIFYKDELEGVLYLDNRLVNSVFREEDLDAVNLLSGQAGISIANAILYKGATLDGLTGIYNRAFLDNYLYKAVQVVNRYKRRLSVLIIDVDHFMENNDRYGHITGDQLLREVSVKITESVRCSDLVARYGGDEFLVILPGTALEDARLLAQKIRVHIEKNKIMVKNEGDKEKIVSVTVSIGVAELTAGEDRLSLLQRADECLYRAKEYGRNQVAG